MPVLIDTNILVTNAVPFLHEIWEALMRNSILRRVYSTCFQYKH